MRDDPPFGGHDAQHARRRVRDRVREVALALELAVPRLELGVESPQLLILAAALGDVGAGDQEPGLAALCRAPSRTTRRGRARSRPRSASGARAEASRRLRSRRPPRRACTAAASARATKTSQKDSSRTAASSGRPHSAASASLNRRIRPSASTTAKSAGALSTTVRMKSRSASSSASWYFRAVMSRTMITASSSPLATIRASGREGRSVGAFGTRSSAASRCRLRGRRRRGPILGDLRRQDLAHVPALELLGRDRQVALVLDVRVEVAALARDAEHVVRHRVEQRPPAALALAQRLDAAILLDRDPHGCDDALDELGLLPQCRIVDEGRDGTVTSYSIRVTARFPSSASSSSRPSVSRRSCSSAAGRRAGAWDPGACGGAPPRPRGGRLVRRVHQRSRPASACASLVRKRA